MTPAEFLHTHGDIHTWSTTHHETYEHLLEAHDPTFTKATTDGVHILGRHTHDGHHTLALGTPDPTTTPPTYQKAHLATTFLAALTATLLVT